MSGLLVDDQSIEKAKVQVPCLYPNLDLSELDYFKVVVEGCLMEQVDLETTLEGDASIEAKNIVENHAPKNINAQEVGGEEMMVSSCET